MAESIVRKSRPAARAAPRKQAAPAASGLRGRIPALSPAQAGALRDFFAAPRHWSLGDGGTVQFMPGTTVAVGETFAVDAEGTRMLLQLDTAAAPQPEPHWSDHRGRARLLAWSLAHERPLMRLSEALGVSLLPQEADAAPEPDGDGLWLAFSIEDEAGHEGATRAAARVHGALHLPAAWLGRLQARAVPVYEDDPPPALGPWRALPVPVRLQFDGPTLDAGSWRGVRPGDVIVVGRGRMPALQARAAHRAWPLAAAPEGWRIAAPAQALSSVTERSPMNETDVPQNNDDGAERDAATGTQGNPDEIARSLPVQLSFDIGRVEIGVGELASLQPGYVFALPSHLEGANVTIRANGRDAGRGEVVAVGDTLGVRLLAWN